MFGDQQTYSCLHGHNTENDLQRILMIVFTGVEKTQSYIPMATQRTSKQPRRKNNVGKIMISGSKLITESYYSMQKQCGISTETNKQKILENNPTL